MFAPKGEKQLHKAIEAQDAQAIKQVGFENPDFRLPAYSLSGLMLVTSEPREAEELLSKVFGTGLDPISEGVTAELPLNRDALGPALAELKQVVGDVAGAIDVVEQLELTTYSAVSLAELYAQIGRWDDVIELTEGVKNDRSGAHRRHRRFSCQDVSTSLRMRF